MRRVWVLVLTGVFLASTVAWGRQDSAASVAAPPEHRPVQGGSRDCGGFPEAIRLAILAVESDRRELAGATDAGGANAMRTASATVSDLQQDVRNLEQKELDFEQCAASSDPPADLQAPQNSCSSERLFKFQMNHDGEPERDVPIWYLPGSAAFFYEAGMTIDADGAPNAYHPDNTGIDDLANAGGPGNWPGLAKNADGEPIIQGPNDPFPGYYVSATALTDRTKPMNDPAHYVDSTKIPYIVLPGALARQLNARPGDFSAVINLNNGKSSYAIFGDVGPSDRIGEGSVALAENLAIRSDARNGGAHRNILFVVFPGSGNGRPRTIEEINSETESLLQPWGGNAPMTACPDRPVYPPLAGARDTN